jgi:glycosyltransferase involved in cell wall biosynthesis
MLAQRVLIFEPNRTGHHLHYVRVLMEALRGHVGEMTVALSVDAEDSPEFNVHLAAMRGSDVHFLFEFLMPPSLGAVQIATAAIRYLYESTRRHPVDRIYVPYADGMLQIAGLCSSLLPRRWRLGVPVEALMMRGGFAYPWASRKAHLRHELLYRAVALAPVTVLHVLDPIVLAEIQRRGGPLAKVARLLPEAVDPMPSMDRCQALTSLGLPPGRRYVVSAGLLDSRKGIGLLLDAAAADTGLPKDCALVLLGRVADDLRPAIAAAQARLGDQLVVIDRYASEPEFAAAILAADLIVVPYPIHQGSSGLVVRAAAAGKYLLASSYGWLGWVTQKFELGATVDVTDASAFRASLLDSIARSHSHSPAPASKRFAAYHTAENQRTHWRRGLTTLTNHAPGTVVMEWPS